MATRLGRSVARLPRMMRAGLALAVLSAAIDLAYHFISESPGAGHGPVVFTGHLVTLVGVVVTLIGLFGAALRRRPRETKPTTEGELP